MGLSQDSEGFNLSIPVGNGLTKTDDKKNPLDLRFKAVSGQENE